MDADPSAGELVDAPLRGAHIDHDLAIAANAADALERLAGEPWDICLVEQDLPDASGLDLIHAARARGITTTPFILLTTTLTGSIDERALTGGVSDCVERPLTGSRLPRAIRYALRNRRETEARLALEASRHGDEKLEALGRLAGGVAHEVNNVLTAILGYADLVAEQLDPDEQVTRDVNEIRRAAERATTFIRQLTLLSDGQSVDSVELDVNATLSEFFEALDAGGNVRVTLRLGNGLGTVRGDVVQLTRALNHLIVNALEAMPCGGDLTVETTVATIAEEIRLAGSPVLPTGSYVKICLSDTGRGMDEATRARVFEPFFTTKQKGHGLGLPLAYGLVRQCGGGITVESAPGLGAAVSIYLQLARDEALDGGRSGADDGEAARATLLFIEHNIAVRDFSVRELRRRGYTVIEAANVDEALARAAESPRAPDLLVVEIPDSPVPGLIPVARLTEQYPGLRVLTIVNSRERAPLADGPSIEGASVVRKPFTPAQLAEHVQRALDAPPSR